MQTKQTTTKWWSDLFSLTLIIGIFSFIFLGTRPLFTPDEGRYAEIAREMVKNGHFITPYLDGIKYFEKPVLFYWLSTLAIKLGGLSLWALRSVNALLGIAGCLITYCAGRLLFNRATGLLAAGLLATSGLYFTMAHTISLDLPVSVFISLTLYAILYAFHPAHARHSRISSYIAAIAAGMAVLTKGLIGVVFPGLIVFIWLCLLGNFRLLKKLYIPTACLIFLIVILPWHILVQKDNPEFFHFYFIEQHILRYTTKGIGHYQPCWFFIPYLIGGFFPWIIFLPAACLQTCITYWRTHREPTRLFLLVWAATIFIFFSFSQSKLIPYILPMFPAIALLTADYLQRNWLCGKKAARNQSVLIAMIIAMAIVLLIAINIIPRYQTRSILPLATIIRPLLTKQDTVVAYHQYYQDLPFYLQRTIMIVKWKNELTFGMQHQANHSWMIDDKTFWQYFHSNTPLFVIMSNDSFQQFRKMDNDKNYYILGKTPQNILISNHLRKSK